MAVSRIRLLIISAGLLTAVQMLVLSLFSTKVIDAPFSSMPFEGMPMLEGVSMLQMKSYMHAKKKSQGAHAQQSSDPGFVTIFSAQCTPYHDWQSVTLFDTWQAARVPGTLVRILACSESERRSYRREQLVKHKSISTHVHDDAFFDGWPNLNKPWGIHSWLTNGSGASLPNDTVIFILDPDISFREENVWQTLSPLVARARSGVPIGIDCEFVLAGMKHHKMAVPSVFLAQSDLNRLQSVASPILMRKDQLSKIAFNWNNITKHLMKNKDMLALVHDGSNPAPWIAEMYGYSISAAAASLPRHESQVQWPTFRAGTPPYASSNFGEIPLLLHYAHSFRLCDRHFGKRLFYSIDLLDCKLSSRVQRALRPPSGLEVRNQSCRACMGKGDVFGEKPRCMAPASKIVSYEAWARVYIAVMKWRANNCPAASESLARSQSRQN